MKDIKYILIFTAIGLALAFAVSGPLRRPPQEMVGTPLRPMMGSGSTIATGSNQPASEKKQVYAQGTISLGNGIMGIEGRPLFLIIKAAVDGRPAGGPPVAVKRIDRPTFPLSFSLTNENNMVGSDFYDGDLVLIARLDKDGAAGPKQPEDFESSTIIKAAESRQAQVTIRR